MHFKGLLYRAINPVYALDPLSGDGAKRFGGRFNRKGMLALYTSLSPEVAIREANQVGALQPTTLVAYEADTVPIFDCTDEALLANRSFDAADLAVDSWRDEMIKLGASKTQILADMLHDEGYAGLLVPSFVKGARQSDKNLVLWTWNKSSTSSLRLIDDEGRLSES
jgi:RES domain-containing protein